MTQTTNRKTSRPLRFVLLEDDWQQAELIKNWLGDQFERSEIEIIETAKQFHARVDGFKDNSPDVFIIDMMVRFTDPDDENEASQGESVDFFRAGARCYEELRSRGLNGRAIIYSVIDNDDLQKANLNYLANIHIQKEEDKTELYNAICKLIC